MRRENESTSRSKTTQHGSLHIFEEFDTNDRAPSFALSHVRQHGMPFVLIVDRDGRIRAADRRPGWRELFGHVTPAIGDRLPERIARVAARHATNPPPDNAATVTLSGDDVVVSVVALDGTDELYACSIWHLNRDRTLEIARSRYLLTNRECELLDHILHGESSAEIGRRLSISLATVEWHTKRLLLKTDSQNRTRMAARVLGWLPDAS